jgi:hypothetical protein
MHALKLFALLAAFLFCAQAHAAGEHWRELHWLVPNPAARTAMHTTVLLPPGKGPFATAMARHQHQARGGLRARAQHRAIAMHCHLERLGDEGLAVTIKRGDGFGHAVARTLRAAAGVSTVPLFERPSRCPAAA